MMDEAKRDEYMLEILDRLARLETKFDSTLDTKEDAEEALVKSNDNAKSIESLEKRMDENDKRWDRDRSEKWMMWVAVVTGIFALGGSFIASL